MYKYENIGFRPIDERDLEIMRKNRNDSSTLLNLGTTDMVSSEQQKKWWQGISVSHSQQWHCVVKDDYETIIGILRFQNIDHVNRVMEMGMDIYPEFRRKGYGYKTYLMAMEYLFLHFNINCIYLKVAAFNQITIKLNEKVGFDQTGYIPQSIFRNGKYWDTFIMTITKDSWSNKYCSFKND